jgi:hypothetical protein
MNGVGSPPARLLCPVPAATLGRCGLASAAVVGVAALASLPLWATVSAGLLAWAPVVRREAAWTSRHGAWLAFFILLTMTQAGHVGEHAAQLVQIHGLGLRGAQARGVFGALDIEWVHFFWNTWILGAVAALAWHYRHNRWLQAALIFAAWHEIEHVSLLATYLTTGLAGTPGLLAQGGTLAGGLPLARPDLHFLYNLVETLPLFGALVTEARRR